jgi:hypothetical protein
MNEIKSSSGSKINLYNKLKLIISTLKSFLTNVLKMPIIITNAPLKIIIIFAIRILNYKLLNEKYQSISRSNSKENKIPSEKSKKYILLFINICNSLFYLIEKREQITYKITIFYLVKEFTLSFISLSNLSSIKTYLSNLYKNDKIITNIINNITLEDIVNINLINLLNLYKKIKI